jgi:hypothetical protein
MRGVIPPLPNTPPWRGAQLKIGAQGLYLYLYLYLYLTSIFIFFVDFEKTIF